MKVQRLPEKHLGTCITIKPKDLIYDTHDNFVTYNIFIYFHECIKSFSRNNPVPFVKIMTLFTTNYNLLFSLSNNYNEDLIILSELVNKISK